MEALETQLTSVGSTTAVLIPEEMLTPLGLQQGSRITLAMRDGQIILRPMESSLEKRKPLSSVEAKGLLDAHSSLHAGQPSLGDESFRERARENDEDSGQPLLVDSISGLRGLFASDRDLVAELQQERRQDKW